MSGIPNPDGRYAGVQRTVQLPPDPRIAEALGLQHSIETALADIVDNSIEAGAAHVWLRFIIEDDALQRILIVDDGRGMTAEKLERSLQLGARREYSAGSLGMYGIGLKASAFSLADVLTVTTVTEGGAAAAMTTPRSQSGEGFRALVHTAPDADARIIAEENPLELEHGTVVDLRGIRGAPVDEDASVRRGWLDDRIRRLRNHFGLVFHRFIDSERVRLTLDVYDARMRDAGPPFHPTAVDPLRPPTGKLGYPRTMTVDLPGGVTTSIECHLLAPGAKGEHVGIFGDQRADWQGVFVYRNDRLLRLGGWDEIAPKKNDLQLARVLIEIGEHDIRWFGMNAEKNGVAFSPELVRAIQSAGDEDVSFKDFLQDARDVLRQSNRREQSLKPIAAMGSGMPEAVEDVAGEVLGFREHEKSVNVRWGSFPPGRIFGIDHDRATIWLNEKHREALRSGSADDEHGLIKTLLFLLFENHFAKTGIQQITRDRIAAVERMIGAALGIAVTAVGEHGAVTLDTPDEAPSVGVTERPEAEDRGEDSPSEDEDARGSAEPPPVSEWKTDSVKQYLEAISRHPLLRADEEVTLARQIEAGLFASERLSAMSESERRSQLGREIAWVAREGDRALQKMTAANLRLVVSIAKRYQNHGLELLDLIQEGNTGLLRAIEKFDYARGLKFSTYATWWIRQAITRAMADQGATIRLPVHMAELGARIREARRRLRSDLDREPSFEEIASAIGEDAEKVALYVRMSRPVLSLNAPLDISAGEDGEDLEPDEYGAPRETVVEFGDVIEDELDLIETAIARSMLSSDIEAVLSRLDDRAAEIIRMRFGLGGDEPKTLDEIGAVFKVTRERIRQLEVKALKRLREPRVMEALGLVSASDPVESPEAPPAVPAPTEPARVAAPSDSSDAPGESAPVSPIAGATSSETSGKAASSVSTLLDAYRQLRHVRSAASLAGVADREAAIMLARLLLWDSGPIDDSDAAPNHGAAWEPAEVDRVLAAHAAGVSLRMIADSTGRTQLAIAWRLLDNTARPVVIPDEFDSHDFVDRVWSERAARADLERDSAVAGQPALLHGAGDALEPELDPERAARREDSLLRVTQKFWPGSRWSDPVGRALIATSEVYWVPGVGASLVFHDLDGARVPIESRARLAELRAAR